MGRSLYRPNKNLIIEDFGPQQSAPKNERKLPSIHRRKGYGGRKSSIENRTIVAKSKSNILLAQVIMHGPILALCTMNSPNCHLPGTASVGYESRVRGTGHFRFLRTIQPECLFCHNDLTPHVPNTETYTWPLAQGIIRQLPR